MPRTTSDIVEEAVSIAQMTHTQMAWLGGVHKTTLSRYLSKKSDLEPGIVWTGAFIERLHYDLEARMKLLERLYKEAADLYINSDEHTRHHDYVESLKRLGEASMERLDVTDEEIEAYIGKRKAERTSRKKQRASKKGSSKKHGSGKKKP